MRSLRILFATHDLAGRGANFIRAEGLARAMVAEGHSVCVLAGSPSLGLGSSISNRGGVEVLEVQGIGSRRLRRAGLDPSEMRGRVSVLRRRRFDVVHVFGHRPAAWWPVRRLRHQLGATIVADWADWYGAGGIAAERRWPGRWTIGRLDEALERRMISCSAAVTVVTRRLEVMALARGVPPGRVLRLTAGTDPQVIRPLDKAEMRRRLGLPTEAGLVMNAGLSAWDGPRVLDVFSRIAARSLDVLLLTVGRPSSKLERAARRQGWASRLVQAPHVPHERLGEFLACADVVVIPFPAKGLNLGRFPNQAADAMAAGRPIVTNPTGDLGAFIGETASGLLSDEDPDAMAAAALSLVKDRSLANELGENGRRAAVGQLAWPLLAAKILALYGSVLSSEAELSDRRKGIQKP